MSWELEHSVECDASREFAWGFWSDVRNWARVDPGVDEATLDGPFAAGSRGTTKQNNQPPVEWYIVDVKEGYSATLDIPVEGASLRITMRFSEVAPDRSRITQHLSLQGEKADDYTETVGGMMEKALPEGMRRMADAIAREARAN